MSICTSLSSWVIKPLPTGPVGKELLDWSPLSMALKSSIMRPLYYTNRHRQQLKESKHRHIKHSNANIVMKQSSVKVHITRGIKFVPPYERRLLLCRHLWPSYIQDYLGNVNKSNSFLWNCAVLTWRHFFSFYWLDRWFTESYIAVLRLNCACTIHFTKRSNKFIL